MDKSIRRRIRPPLSMLASLMEEIGELTPDHKGKLQHEFEEALRVNNEKISKLESELKKATTERKKYEKSLKN
ncbi:MAG: hypothetical protein QXK35_04715 [Nitrososphaerales archaeon]